MLRVSRVPFEIRADRHDPWHPGRCAAVYVTAGVDGQLAGHAAERESGDRIELSVWQGALRQGSPTFAETRLVHEDSDIKRALPGGIQNRLHLLARRIAVPHPRGGLIDLTAPLPPHMVQSWNLLGLDVKRYDPIVNAPEE